MRRLPRTVVCALLVLAATSSYGAKPKGSSEELALAKMCARLSNDRAGAFVAGDNPATIRLGEKYLRVCNELDEPSLMASAYGNIAEAQLAMGNLKNALSAADLCLAASYVETGCHVTKAEALVALSRRKEALAILDAADLLIVFQAKITKERIERGDLRGAELVMTRADARMIEVSRMRAATVRYKLESAAN